MLLLAALATASTLQDEFIEAYYADNSMHINARYKVALPSAVLQALNNGVSLPFAYEVEILRPRWYALYRDIFSDNLKRTYRLSFHSLTHQYRVSQGSYYRSFNSLDEALSTLGILRDWRMLESYISVNNYQDIKARIRMRLDISQLPKPYQITTLGNSDWTLASSWQEFRPHLEDKETKE